MIPFLMDASLPPECSFLPSRHDLQLISITAFLRYAAAQKDARERGKPNWRDLPNDGSDGFDASTVNVALAMSIDIRQELPAEGVRWLYLRNEVKCIRNGGIHVEATLFDEKMRLVAVSHQTGQFVSAGKKKMKKIESRL